MTASISPDENSYSPKDSSESTGFTYGDPNAPVQTESTYVPEREFVLMPLFRRIGELLGIWRQTDREYIYILDPTMLTAPTAQPARELPQAEPLPDQEITFAHESVAADHEEAGLAGVTKEERIDQWAEPAELPPNVSPVVPEPVALEAAATQPELEACEPVEIESPISHFAPLTSEAVMQLSVPSEPEVQAPSYEPRLEEIEAQTAHFDQDHVDGAAAEVQARETPLPAAEVIQPKSAQAAVPQPRRRRDELDEAIAILREAGSKISAAISAADEWLSTKESELVRKAERVLAPAPKPRCLQSSIPARRSNAGLPVQGLTASSEPTVAEFKRETISEPASSPKSEPLPFPSLQREVAWQEQGGPALAEHTQVRPVPTVTVSAVVPRRPMLARSRRRVPFWKRIDWVAQFVPEPVEVLGGVAVAILLVLGISLVGRPASDVLPQQARPRQAGGVTVTTHPGPATTPRTSRPHRTVAPEQRGVAPATHRAPGAIENDAEKDVVTHHYKAKPSPSTQATVAGVRHYSDIE